ncbi:MAG: metallophosphoesterase family protein [Candidatus Dormibacteraeota bacterium]|jgi:DNA repair exonuclease SbcCD nuclease subunit|nr:metallophosphoesterase family protein [Candidatus Dormibacteraeota bacterium]
MRLIHCADVHLDASFSGLGLAAARRRRWAIRQTFRRVVDMAVEQRADALTIGGDLYEDLRSQGDTTRFLQQEFERASCPVLISPGNHDYLHPGSLYSRERWPQNVHIFQGGEFTPYELGGWRVFGVAHLKPKGTGDLLHRFKVPKGGPAVALFHGSERGQLPEQGEGKEDHAPFSEDEIQRSGFRYALLGHFHKPRVGRLLVYPGNPEPLTFGEEGTRGPAVVELDEQGPPRVEIVPVGTFQLAEIEVDVTGCQHSEAIADRVLGAIQVQEDGDVAYRVRVTGELAAGVRLSRQELLERLRVNGRSVELVISCRPQLDLEQLRQAPDARGQFVRSLLARPDFDSELVQAALLAGLNALLGEEPALL